MRLKRKILLAATATLFAGIAALCIAMSHESPCPSSPPPVSGSQTMRAVMQRCYGPPSILTIERVAKPTAGSGQLLIKVRAASLNPYNWHMITGKPYLVRFFKGLGAPTRPGIAADFAGVVETVGSGVTRFKPGDEVFGNAGSALADYLVTDENGDFIRKPAELSFEQAAAIPIAAVTALQGLRDHGRIAAGQKVLINGASGGVGTFAVQIAKALGAEVTGVCSTRNLALVQSLGADHVIDYTKEDFTTGKERYDLIFDTVSNHGLLELRGALEPTGTLVAIGGHKKDLWIGPLWSFAERKIVAAFVAQKLEGFIASINQPDLEYLAALEHAGKLRAPIDRRYPLEETAAALDYIGTQRARGKVIVTVN